MGDDQNSLLALVEYLKKHCPEMLSILASQTDAEFDLGLEGVLEKAADHLEKNANHLTALGEEAISAFLVAYLNMPGLRATQEAHSNGHVDITIEAEHAPPLRRRLGEAKIYNGPKYHVDGLKQLLGRYMTGREGYGFVVEYVTKPKIKDIVSKIRSHMDSSKPCAQKGKSQDHRIRWSFITKHAHSSSERLLVLHLSCNLHQPNSS